MSDLYFGYGSNLDAEDWAAFCHANGFDPGVLVPVGPAVMPGEMLVFDYLSLRRRCGALNIRTRPGARVDGGLFSVVVGGWAALDAKEGHPHVYRREPIVVIANGRRIAAQTYRVTPARRDGYHAPNEAYLAACRRGRARFGLTIGQLDEAASGGRLPTTNGGGTKTRRRT